jgi:glycosyltransferase involved in cell wall biosynthesis
VRITIIALHYAEYSYRLAASLSEKNEVLLILYADNAKSDLGHLPKRHTQSDKLRLIIIDRPKRIYDVLRNARILVNEARKFNPQVIHYQEAFRDELVVAWPFMPKAPTVLTVHDPLPHSGEDTDGFRWSRGRLYRFALRHWTDHVITHGEFLSTELLRNNKYLSGRVSKVAHGILGHPDTHSPRDEIPAPRLLFFGRLYKYKGLSRFIEAVIRLRESGIDVVGVVAGRGPDLAANRSQMLAGSCFEIIDRFIAVEELPSLFNASRAVVLPYVDGTQSGVAAMAFAYGRPVVCTAVGSIPEVVHDGVNGLVVPREDHAALVEALRRVLIDDSLWSHLSHGARASAEGPLSWEAIALNTEQVYEQVISPQPTAC